MQFAANEIIQLTQDIFTTMLGMEVAPLGEATANGDQPRFTACVQIAGTWKGAVVFAAPLGFARRAAAVMFDMTADDAQRADLQDALAELANMIGGNLKTLLPGPSFLSLPSVTEGADYSLTVPGGRLITHVALDCEGQTLEVALFEELPQVARTAACAT